MYYIVLTTPMFLPFLVKLFYSKKYRNAVRETNVALTLAIVILLIFRLKIQHNFVMKK